MVLFTVAMAVAIVAVIVLVAILFVVLLILFIQSRVKRKVIKEMKGGNIDYDKKQETWRSKIEVPRPEPIPVPTKRIEVGGDSQVGDGQPEPQDREPETSIRTARERRETSPEGQGGVQSSTTPSDSRNKPNNKKRFRFSS